MDETQAAAAVAAFRQAIEGLNQMVAKHPKPDEQGKAAQPLPVVRAKTTSA